MSLASGLLAAYNFNSSSLADFYGSGPTLTNTSSRATNGNWGKIGDAWAFGGYQSSNANSELKTTNTLFSPRDSGGQPTTGRTRFFTLWAYANSWTGGDKGIFGTWQGTNNQFLFYCFSDTNIVTAVVDNSNNLHFITMTRPASGAWHFYTAYWDSSNHTYGMSLDNGTPVVGTNSATIKASTDYFSLGTVNTNTLPFNGAIDGLTVHDRMLTADEITYLYKAGSGREPLFSPDAEFSGTPTRLITSTSVSFTDASTDVPTSWAWTFGSGEGTSTSQNPSHTYNTAGDFTVGLTATNTGDSNLETKTNYIHVEDPVVAAFSADATAVVEGTLVTFTDASTGTPESWAWAFGSGEGTSTSQNPTHTYNTAGVYTVSLDASKTDPSSTDNETKTNYITVVAPVVAAFVASDRTVTIGEYVLFTDTSTGAPSAWSWAFGTGEGTSTTQSPLHQYNVPGIFTVSLTASRTGPTSSDNETKTAYITVTTEPPPDEAERPRSSYFVMWTDDNTERLR